MDPNTSFSTSPDISDLLLLISQPPVTTESLSLDLMANIETKTKTEESATASCTAEIEYSSSPGSQSLLPTRVPSFNDINGISGTLSQAISPLQPPMFEASLQLSMGEIAGSSCSMPPAQGMPFVLTPTHERRVLRRHSKSAPHPYIPEHSRRNSMVSAYPSQRSSRCIVPSINQDGSYKCCANCLTAETPSWRRHPDTQQLLCNACGLYLRLHRKSRPITIDEAGHIQVIRKNAAVQRDPINLASQNMGRASYLPLQQQQQQQQQQHNPGLSAQVGGYSSLRTTSSNASLQDIGEYSSVDFMFAPTYSASQPRIAENMMHLHIADSRNEFPASYSTNSGWIPEISSGNQPSSTAVDDDLVKALQSVKDKTCAEN